LVIEAIELWIFMTSIILKTLGVIEAFEALIVDTVTRMAIKLAVFVFLTCDTFAVTAYRCIGWARFGG
jgi:hypothetical protein